MINDSTRNSPNCDAGKSIDKYVLGTRYLPMGEIDKSFRLPNFCGAGAYTSQT